MQPIKVLEDRRVNYLMSLKQIYQDLGYPTKVNLQCRTLSVFDKNVVLPQVVEEVVIEKWID